MLFDIDGTLIADGGAARQAYAHALQAVYGYRTNLRRYDFSGRTDPQITHMVLGDAGLSPAEIEAAMPQLWEHYLAALERNAPGRVRVLPGIGALLDALAADGRVMLGLLTGNIERGARVKLMNAAPQPPLTPSAARGKGPGEGLPSTTSSLSVRSAATRRDAKSCHRSRWSARRA